MNRGFSLIEMIMYCALLSLFIVGIFFSTLSFVYTSMSKPALLEDHYQLLIKNYHGN